MKTKPKTKIFIFGLKNAGKTEIARYLEANASSVNFSSTNLLDNELWEIYKIRCDMWKEPGQETFRKIWLRGIEIADLLLFILDTSDKDRYNEAIDEFEQIIQEFLRRYWAPIGAPKRSGNHVLYFSFFTIT